MSKQLIWNGDLRQKPWKVALTALVAVGTEGMEGQLWEDQLLGKELPAPLIFLS